MATMPARYRPSIVKASLRHPWPTHLLSKGAWQPSQDWVGEVELGLTARDADPARVVARAIDACEGPHEPVKSELKDLARCVSQIHSS